MTDRKDSTSQNPDFAHPDQSSDELFDRHSLSESDAEFLSELDRVLADTANPLAPAQNQVTVEETSPPSPLEPTPASRARDENEPWERATQSAPLATGAMELTDNTHFPLDQSLSEQELRGEDDWGHAPSPDWQQPQPIAWDELPAAPPAATAEKSTALAWAEPLEPDRVLISKAAAAQSARERDLAPPPARLPEPAAPQKLDWSLPESPPGGADWDQMNASFPEAEPLPETTATSPTTPSVVEASAHPMPSPAPGGARWPAILAMLLAAVGIGLGGASLWSLNTMQGPLPESAAPSSLAILDESRLHSLEQRLDQSLKQVSTDLVALNTGLEGRLAQRDQRQTEDLEEIRGQVTELRTHMGELQEQLSAVVASLPSAKVTPKAAPKVVSSEPVSSASPPAQVQPAPTPPVTPASGSPSKAATQPVAAPPPAQTQASTPPATPAPKPGTKGTTETIPNTPPPSSQASVPAPKPAPKVATKPAVAPGPLPKPSHAIPPGEQGWVVNLSSFPTEKGAEAERQRLTRRDIQAEVREVSKDDHIWYRVTVTGFADAKEANAYASQIRRMRGFSDAWVGRD